MGSAKQPDNPLIHKPTCCRAISAAAVGGGEDISFASLSLKLVSFFFFISLLTSSVGCNFPLFMSHLLPPPNFLTGATVLVVNATDLDASREFGQASLIYSLEGSSQFRLNSRSGRIVDVNKCVTLHF